jgi:hypothetical protein
MRVRLSQVAVVGLWDTHFPLASDIVMEWEKMMCLRLNRVTS